MSNFYGRAVKSTDPRKAEVMKALKDATGARKITEVQESMVEGQGFFSGRCLRKVIGNGMTTWEPITDLEKPGVFPVSQANGEYSITDEKLVAKVNGRLSCTQIMKKKDQDFCADCGISGERTGHMDCPYPGRSGNY